MNKILNLTQHTSTPEQTSEGVVDLIGNALEALKFNLTFVAIPTKKSISERAERIASLASANGFDKVMIGGAPYLMSALESALKARKITPLYAFSERVSREEIQEDGTVRKISTFQHRGFIEV